MDNNNSLNNNKKNKKFKLSVTSFFIIFTIVIVIIGIIISNFENNSDIEKDGSTFFKPIICLIFFITCIYIIHRNINDKKTEIMGYSMDRGLVVYIFILILISMLL
jgi:amino acid permease